MTHDVNNLKDAIVSTALTFVKGACVYGAAGSLVHANNFAQKLLSSRSISDGFDGFDITSAALRGGLSQVILQGHASGLGDLSALRHPSFSKKTLHLVKFPLGVAVGAVAQHGIFHFPTSEIIQQGGFVLFGATIGYIGLGGWKYLDTLGIHEAMGFAPAPQRLPPPYEIDGPPPSYEHAALHQS